MSRNASTDTRPSLLLRLRDKDDSAWHEFFAIYTPAVYGYAIGKGLQPSDAEDVSQEVLLEVAKSIRSFEYQPERGRFRDWLGKIAWRRLARFWNAQQVKRNETNNQEEEEAGPSDPAWVDEYQAAILRQALENIRPSFAEVTWNVFLAVWKDGNTASDTAVRFQIPIEVVYNAKSRVLKHLESEVVRISNDCAWLPH